MDTSRIVYTQNLSEPPLPTLKTAYSLVAYTQNCLLSKLPTLILPTNEISIPIPFKNSSLLFKKHQLYLLNCRQFSKLNFVGDEILAINGKSLQGKSHDEAINEFRAIKQGPVILRIAKREPDQEPIVIVKE